MIKILMAIFLFFITFKFILERIKFLSIMYWLEFKGIKEPTEIEMEYVSTMVAKNIGRDIKKRLNF